MKKFIAADATKWITENAIHAELGEQAEKMLALLTEQYAAAENVTEETITITAICKE